MGMKKKNLDLIKNINEVLGDKIKSCKSLFDMVTIEVNQEPLIYVLNTLKNESRFDFSQLIDLAGVDYSAYSNSEWETKNVGSSAFYRGRKLQRENVRNEKRFAVIYHLLSINNNIRLRVRCYTSNNEPPCIPSVNNIWNSANWFEREAFDLFGIFFIGHEDLRRILTDYGFIGHPFRKDFPLIGEMEVRYDFKEKRIIYDPVSITERTLVPRVIRKDNRYK